MKPILEYSSGLASVCNSHDKVPWAKSKALLGSLTGLVRSRVNELQNPDPEKPLAPHWRAPCLDNSDLSFGFQCDWKPPKVQQRGVEATRGIIVRMLEGLDCPEKQKILVVDMLPNRRGV